MPNGVNTESHFNQQNREAILLAIPALSSDNAHMILFKLKERPETRGEGFPCKAFRDAIEVSLNRDGFEFGLFHQYQHKSDGTWHTSHTDSLAIVINRHWQWGDKHMYYDGPHCIFSIGFVHIHYSRLGWRCKC